MPPDVLQTPEGAGAALAGTVSGLITRALRTAAAAGQREC